MRDNDEHCATNRNLALFANRYGYCADVHNSEQKQLYAYETIILLPFKLKPWKYNSLKENTCIYTNEENAQVVKFTFWGSYTHPRWDEDES